MRSLKIALIALTMEAVSASKTSFYFYKTTRRNIPECCHLYILASVRTLNLSYVPVIHYLLPICSQTNTFRRNNIVK
jgi:hypothetical protein